MVGTDKEIKIKMEFGICFEYNSIVKEPARDEFVWHLKKKRKQNHKTDI